MPRPKRSRHVDCPPVATYYKPQGIPMVELEEALLSVDEFEAIRLVDGEGLGRDDVAERMSVSKPTLCRILASARSTVASALASGKALRIDGGHYKVVNKNDK